MLVSRAEEMYLPSIARTMFSQIFTHDEVAFKDSFGCGDSRSRGCGGYLLPHLPKEQVHGLLQV
jgi:hypothetical protein